MNDTKEKRINMLLNENKSLLKEAQELRLENFIHHQEKINYRNILYTMRDTVEQGDIDGIDYNITYVNKAYCEYFGVEEENVINTDAMKKVIEEDKAMIYEMMKDVTPDKPIYRYSCRVRRYDGEIAWVENEGYAFFDNSGKAIGYQEVGRDITEYKSAEEIAKQFRLNLEKKVKEKTLELNNSNIALSKTNNYLKTILNQFITYDGENDSFNINTDITWKSDMKHIKEKIQKDIYKNDSPIYYLINNQEEFFNKKINFITPKKDIQCFASGVFLNKFGKVNQIMLILQPFGEMHHPANQVKGNYAQFTFTDIVSESPIMKDTIEFADRIAFHDVNIMIEGESGTGKELLAQSIHNASKRMNGPFVAINCGAISKNLIGSELFGYVEGSFTGAIKGGKPGKFEIAEKGTVFLDEIGEMPLEQQVFLLRILQENTVTRIGGKEVIPIDVRIICATNKNLLDEVEKGNFRRDLYYRLNIINLRMPPLREIKEDIPVLFKHFIESLDKGRLYENIKLPEDLIHMLMDYNWPGNVRELKNITERIFYLANNGPITSELLRSELFFKTQKNKKQNFPETFVEIDSIHYKRYQKELKEKKQLMELIEKHKFNMTKVAAEMCVSRTTLYRRLNKYGINY